jgi:hypothetical protein
VSQEIRRGADLARAIELHFSLEVDDDGWPPVAVEGLPCTDLGGEFRVESPPLFVKGLSVGDIISVALDANGNVASWQSIQKSKRSTIWILRLEKSNCISDVLAELRALTCHTVQLSQCGSYAVDVPEEVEMKHVDACLARLDPETAAVAFPSFRHEDQ